MRMVAPSRYNTSPRRRSSFENSLPLWEHGFHNWSQIMYRGPNGRPYFMEERELQWTNPSIKFPLQDAPIRALDYLMALLSSKDPPHWQSLCQELTDPQGANYSIVPRWNALMGQNWGSLPGRPSPLVVDRAIKQLFIESSLSKRTALLEAANGTNRTRILLNFPAKGKARTLRGQAGAKRVRSTTIEPLRGSNAPGDKASIQQILARSDPRLVRHNRRSTWVEEILV